MRDAAISLQTGRVMARAWADELRDDRRLSAVRVFITEAVQAYIEASGTQVEISQPDLPLTYILDTSAVELAHTLGRAAASVALENACYELSATYTAMLPGDIRTAWGAFYTPPALTERLLTLAVEAGTDWRTARVLDPACGGGAFLLPVAFKMRDALPGLHAEQLLEHFRNHLHGFEIDPFAAWLTRTWLQIAFSEETGAATAPFPEVIEVCNSLDQLPKGEGYDLVIGNPPYGRIKLPANQRTLYARSLFGHANLYGVFTDIALRWTRKGGVIAYVTPTSFLGGEYFKALRGLLATEAPPIAFDFVTARKGVFDGVLQETMLSTYRKGGRQQAADVHFLMLNGTASVTHAGRFALPAKGSDPWLAPRTPADNALVQNLELMDARLSDWGYTVSTGPLVWNRFKDQFRARSGKDTLPVIWAEAVTADGRFLFRAEKRNHQPYFRPVPADEWLKVSTPCVLLQRTTAKEQARRLIAAELPESFIKAHGGVIVENHLNMIRPIVKNPPVSPSVVAAILNSNIIDRAFRCISGSVAVSAFELEAIPLPRPEELTEVAALVAAGAGRDLVDQCLEALFLEAR
ncbi:adenine-specific DNA-methyltransferase [Rhizobium sp. PP-F2F-G36]|nr:adenine-specific DNA-methyltransferase [Rhizobium sp. PP-F2F-G36]